MKKPIDVHFPQAVTQPQDSGLGAQNNNGASVFIPVNTKYALTNYAQVADYLGRSRTTVKAYRSSGKIPAHLIAPNRQIFFTDELDAAVRLIPRIMSSKAKASLTPREAKPRQKPGLSICCYLKPDLMFIVFRYRNYPFTIPCSPVIWNNAEAIMKIVDEVIQFQDELHPPKTAAL